MFQPSKKILQAYAQVMVNFALGHGKGIKKNDVVFLGYDSEALPLALAVYQQILKKGAFPIVKNYEEEFERIFFNQASDNQLKFFPKKYTKALVGTIDHRLYLIAQRDPFLLKKVNPQKIVLANKSRQLFKKWLFEKEDQGKLTWSLCLYGTEKVAQEAGLTLKGFWQQIIKACFLDYDKPVKKWQTVFSQINILIKKLNQLPIKNLHVIAKNTDLYILLGDKRQWLGGRGANIPSFEIFTSPDWRGTNGKIFFDFPLYRYGNLIKNIYLEFKEGRVIKAHADQGQSLLKALISQKNADKIGEFSLTDKRFSRIDHFMANTLYDENFGGRWGNSHLALGSAYHEAYRGLVKKMKKKDWWVLGFNDSVEHTDIINTQPKIVEVILKNNQKILIYKNGQFTI